jgi:poly-gamma-glutamate capsule biosynthesis protein CapA/YwtB (metallophosphatase superfamily)
MKTPHPPGPARQGLAGRPVLTVTIVLATLVGAGLGGVALANRDGGRAPRWEPGAVAATAPGDATTPGATPETISMSATGDIIMGNAPDQLPAGDGRGFFDSVSEALAADLVMGNLEQPLTGDTGTSKCGAGSTNCFAFRAPPSYAAHLKDAGFELLNTANNHGRDYGLDGYRNTQRALEQHGLLHTGASDEITVAEVEGVRVAVVGFASYAGFNSLTDLSQARRVVQTATERADIVVVQVHMGAEGADRTRVRPGTETHLGENRGDPMRFSRAVIDAGADLVVGHGPHVLRGMEFYRGRLIAYSLGNFAGGGNTLRNSGRLGLGGVLKVSLTSNGEWGTGTFLSTAMDSAGRPVRDERERGRDLVAQLSAADFPDTGAQFDDATIIPPAPR